MHDSFLQANRARNCNLGDGFSSFRGMNAQPIGLAAKCSGCALWASPDGLRKVVIPDFWHNIVSSVLSTYSPQGNDYTSLLYSCDRQLASIYRPTTVSYRGSLLRLQYAVDYPSTNTFVHTVHNIDQTNIGAISGFSANYDCIPFIVADTDPTHPTWRRRWDHTRIP